MSLDNLEQSLRLLFNESEVRGNVIFPDVNIFRPPIILDERLPFVPDPSHRADSRFPPTCIFRYLDSLYNLQWYNSLRGNTLEEQAKAYYQMLSRIVAEKERLFVAEITIKEAMEHIEGNSYKVFDERKSCALSRKSRIMDLFYEFLGTIPRKKVVTAPICSPLYEKEKLFHKGKSENDFELLVTAVGHAMENKCDVDILTFDSDFSGFASKYRRHYPVEMPELRIITPKRASGYYMKPSRAKKEGEVKKIKIGA